MARILKPVNIVIALLVILILIGIALAVGYASLPAYLGRLLPKLAADAGLADLDLEVRRVGFFGADLEKIRLGSDTEPGLALDSVQIDYTPEGLLNKKIDRVVLSGIQLSFRYQDGRLQFDPSLGALFQSRPPRDKKSTSTTAGLLPFERLSVRHARVQLIAGDRTHTFPLELDLIPENGSRDQVTVKAVLWPRDQRLESVARVDLEKGTANIHIKAPAIRLKAFADLFEPVAGLQLGGIVKIDSKVDLKLSPLKLSAAEATLGWLGKGIEFQSFRIGPVPDGPEAKSYWQLKATTTDTGNWQVKADPLLAESHARIRLSDLVATVKPSSDGFEITGQISAEPLSINSKQLVPVPLNLIHGPVINGDFNATIGPQAGWSFTFDGKPSRRQLELQSEGRQLKALIADFQASGRGGPDKMTTEYRAALRNIKMRDEFLSAAAMALSVKGKTTIVPDNPDYQLSEIGLNVSNVSGGTDKFKFSGAKAGYYGTLQTGNAEVPKISGSARFSVGNITVTGTPAQIKNIAGNLPLRWPPPGKTGKAGHFRIRTASFSRYTLSDVTGVIRQTQSGFKVAGRHKDAIIPGLDLKFNGQSRLVGRGAPVIEFSANANRSAKAAPIDLGTLMPGGQGVQLSGRLSAEAELNVSAGVTSGRSTLRLTDGMVQASKEKFQINGLNLSLAIPGLPVLRSAPGQELRFASANLGDIQINNGHIFFQIEPAPAVLLEKGQFDWSEGQVDMHSTRIFLDQEDYDLTLFCDRLNLARLLEQFGAANAEGNGTVSGKIPILYRNQKWSVADGFLFSSPGEGGQIRVQGTEILTAGIPKNSPQYMQLEIAREALKDYDFKWAKLTISTEGEDMLLKLQLDGKPAKTLPFAFRKDIGSFARVEGQAEGSKFQGIRLDVNFRLPLNKILQYKSIIQMMRKN